MTAVSVSVFVIVVTASRSGNHCIFMSARIVLQSSYLQCLQYAAAESLPVSVVVRMTGVLVIDPPPTCAASCSSLFVLGSGGGEITFFSWH